MRDNYHVHIYFNHVLVDSYHVYGDLYVLGTLSMTRNTYTLSIENCTMYRNTYTMFIDMFNMYEYPFLCLGIMYHVLGHICAISWGL
jgi:hypothetical protein